jgi:hypothetical protein
MSASRKKRLSPKNLLLNVTIVVLGAVVAFLGYSFISNTFISKPVEWKTQNTGRNAEGEVIQLDILNGCGVSGVAQKFTDYLRRRNFDVVQSSNYKNFDVKNTLVIDRIGDKESARKVARALGVKDEFVDTWLNMDYLVHVSIIIGHDYNDLKPLE